MMLCGTLHPGPLRRTLEIAVELTQISGNVDFNLAGKQQGHLFIPYSHNLAG